MRLYAQTTLIRFKTKQVYCNSDCCTHTCANALPCTEANLRHTYLLTPQRRVLLVQLTDLQLVKKFPAFHGTIRLITALTSVRHLSLPWASPILSIYPHPTSCRSILISTHLRLGLLSGLFPSGFPTKTLYNPPLLTRTRHMPSPSH